MRDLSDEHIKELWENADSPGQCMRAAIAADRALNAADRDVMRQALDAIDAFTDPEGRMPEDTGEFRDLALAGESLRDALAAAPTPPVEQQYVTYVDGGALKMALNVLRRAGKNEVADELEKTAVRSTPAEQQREQEPVGWFQNTGTDTDPLYEQLADEFKNEPDAIALYTHRTPSLAELRAKVEALERFSFGMGKQLVGRDEVLAEIDKMGGGV